MIILSIVSIALIIALVVVLHHYIRKTDKYQAELEYCYEEIDELNRYIKEVKLELDEAYEELAA